MNNSVSIGPTIDVVSVKEGGAHIGRKISANFSKCQYAIIPITLEFKGIPSRDLETDS